MMPCTKSCSTSSCRHSSFRIGKARTKETTAIDCRCTELYGTVPKWIRSLSFSWPSPRRPTRSTNEVDQRGRSTRSINEVDHRGRSLADGGPPQTSPWPQQGGDATFAESKSRLWKSARAEASLRLRLGTLSEETSLTGGSRDPILSVTRDAKQVCNEPTQNQRHQRERIRKAKVLVEDLIARMSEGGESLSALTSHSSESDFEVDQTSFRRPQIDNLDVIFRFAAEQDHARRLPLSSSSVNNHQDPDNLDAMVQWVASQGSERDVALDDRSFSSDYSPATPPDRRPPSCVSSSRGVRTIEMF